MTEEAHPESSSVSARSFQASCYCGKASYKVEGDPIFSLYCHCTICQRIHGCPFIHALHYTSKAFTWTHTDPDAVFIQSAPGLPWIEWRCRSCFGFIGAESPTEGRWSLRGAHFRRNAKGLIENWDLIKPTGHMFYDTRMLDVDDGLPKWEGYANGSKRLDVT